MDLLCICALVAVLIKQESCHRPYLIWYSVNAGLASVSLAFLTWWSRSELRDCYTSKKSMAISYLLEVGYLTLSVFAWIILSDQSSSAECHRDAPSVTELLVDMIILQYMRSLRLLSVLFFVVMCGPLLLVCWFKNKPTPPVDADKLRKNFTKVTLRQLSSLRKMNYRHKMSEPQKS